ncbi:MULTISPECIES: YggT family protein [Thermotoga]|jgi:YggT family protein|uniref:YggT family protein n=4 Tax=Thermotoga TaxID=2335 RepID=Q9X254_THEMA|nr:MULTISPECIES: YggT family protein [Thermotoga]KUK22933.1 MAG: Uncharacterized protein XD57_0964 [Thermotoga petrophila]KUK33485.1 MAG: Uncharacterized protein XD64_0683 [Thermotoga sp. 47_83]MBZ4661547.1 hypothetical protein [Thermotoga sp.]AAD36797.1 conserved hypothetical protein [Thermotoga maritima MSB8]ABQ47045.1 protein of unknown function YGGT [Thermotoga petrophila RKU-1]
MFVIANLLRSIAVVLRTFIYVEIVSIVVSAIFSWTTPYYYHPVRRFFDALSSIVLNPIRRVVPPIGSVDISPMIAIFILMFLDGFLVQTLFDLAVRLS